MTLRSARAGAGAMVLATMVWGGTFVILRDSLVSFPPAALVFARFAVASAVYAVLLLRRGPAVAAAARVGVAAGLCAAGGFLFQAIGLTSTSAGSSAFLTCAGTLLAGFFAWPLLGQRPPRVLVAGIALALAGSALLSLRSGLRLGTGELWTLLGALCYALQIVALASAGPGRDALALAGVQSLTIALVLSPWAGAAVREVRALDAAGGWRFAYLAGAGSVIAPLLQVSAQQVLSPGRIGLLFALEPVFALLFAVSVGAERFAARWWWGAALIVIAVLIVEGRAARARPIVRPATG
jgi:drug/metabolite transporter (DMT)-like permease